MDTKSNSDVKAPKKFNNGHVVVESRYVKLGPDTIPFSGISGIRVEKEFFGTGLMGFLFFVLLISIAVSWSSSVWWITGYVLGANIVWGVIGGVLGPCKLKFNLTGGEEYHYPLQSHEVLESIKSAIEERI